MFWTVLFMLMISLITTFLIIVSMMVKKKTLNSREKQSMFECGFDFMCNLRVPLSIHFFMVSIVFLIFDIEIILIIPIILMFKKIKITLILMMFLMFMVIMMIGLIYEWTMGLINWMV